MKRCKALANGGSNYIENIQPLCRSCNSSKSNRYTFDYRPLAIFERRAET